VDGKESIVAAIAFIVLSKAFGKIKQEYQVDHSKLTLFPGVDISRFQTNLSRQPANSGWPQDRMILFTPRRLVHRMGLDKLLSALAKIKPLIPDVWLAIASWTATGFTVTAG